MRSMTAYWVTTYLGKGEPYAVMGRASTLTTAIRMAKSWSRRDGCRYKIVKVELMEIVRERRAP